MPGPNNHLKHLVHTVLSFALFAASSGFQRLLLIRIMTNSLDRDIDRRMAQTKAQASLGVSRKNHLACGWVVIGVCRTKVQLSLDVCNQPTTEQLCNGTTGCRAAQNMSNPWWLMEQKLAAACKSPV